MNFKVQTLKSNRVKILALAFISFITLSSADLPKKILSHNQMVDIIVDLELAKSLALYQTISTETSIDIYRKNVISIYIKHSTSSEIFTKSYNYYSNRPSELLSIYNGVVDELENLL